MRTWRKEADIRKRQDTQKDELEQISTRLKHYEQCESLQKRMHRYCELKGLEYEEIGSWLQCKMPSGVEVTIYGSTLTHLSLRRAPSPIYGHFFRQGVRFRTMVYILSPNALYLYNLLGEEIKELENKKENEL